MAGNQYFTPDSGPLGTQAYQQSGEPQGWYQFIRTGFTGDTINVTVPEAATGFEIEARTTVRFSLSPDSNAPGSAYMELAPGETYIASGRSNINQFSVWLPAGGDTDFVITFYQGNIGPIPGIFRRSGTSPGPPPPPPPGAAQIPINNVVHVMANGNDATGTRNRMDLPFATPGAAEAAANNGDTIVVWQGGYLVRNLGTKRLSWLLLEGSALTCNTGTVFTTVEDIDIAGSGVLQCSGGNACIQIDGGRTIRINGVDMLSSARGVILNDGQLIGASNITSESNGIDASDSPALLYLTGNITANIDFGIYSPEGLTGWVRGNVTSINLDGVSCDRGALTIYGNVTGRNNGITSFTDAQLAVYGDVRCNGGPGAGAVVVGSNSAVNIYGDVYCAVSIGVKCGSGRVNVVGDIVADTASTIKPSGNFTHVGNITGLTAGVTTEGNTFINGNITSSGVTVDVQGGSFRHYGSIESTGDHGLDVSAGSAEVHGDITGTGVGAWTLSGGTLVHYGNTLNSVGIGAFMSGGSAYIYGNITSTALRGLVVTGGDEINVRGDITGANQGVGQNTNTASTIIRLYGKVQGLGGVGLNMQDSPNMTVHAYGEVVGSTQGSSISTGTVHFYGLVRTTAANNNALFITASTPVVNLYASSRFQASGTGTSIYATAPDTPTIRSYHASGNTLPSGVITVVGTFNVIV